jgi:hypothetical protein
MVAENYDVLREIRAPSTSVPTGHISLNPSTSSHQIPVLRLSDYFPKVVIAPNSSRSLENSSTNSLPSPLSTISVIQYS